MRQNPSGRPVPSNVMLIPKANFKWNAKPSTTEMEQVRKLVPLIDLDRLHRCMVAKAWWNRRLQPCRERVTPMWE